jgi:transcriptional regulator NrdR family protein
MSHYSCPICSGPSSVIETRVSQTRLRRRRACAQKHRFTTIEVPHQAPKELKKLMNWLAKGGLNPELVDYAKEQINAILFGTAEEDEE